MDMLRSRDLADVDLPDWRKLAQGLHARFVLDDLVAAARFVTAVVDVAGPQGDHLRIRVQGGLVDLEAVSDDAVHRDSEGGEHVVEWVTQDDVDLASRLSALAVEHGARPDPGAVTELEIGLGTPRPGAVAPVWAALLTGEAASQGRGSPGDEVRDASGRVPNLWFDEDGGPRLHLEVYVPAEVRETRLAAVLAAGGRVVDDTGAPATTVVADPDGNRGVLCVDAVAAGL